MDEIFIDLNFLTESERDQLQDVLARDDEFRRQEKKRLGDLKKELETVKKSSAIKVSETSNLQPGKVCARCHQTFGVVFNTGAFCPKCKAKVCKSCREVTQGSWLCSLCAKVREVKAKSGAWFFDQVKTKSEARSLFGTSLIRASLKRRKFSSSDSFDEIQTPPVIGLHNHGNNKLHRPIPVHMSAIRESSNDSKDQSRHNRDQIMNEINQNNSKPYSKAVPVKKQLHSSFSDNEDRESAGDSGNSTPTKLQYDDSEVIVTKNDHNISEEEKQKDDKEVFQFLDSIHHEMKNDPPDQSRDVSRDRQSYGNDDDVQTPETSLEFHSLPNELEQPGYTKDHLKVMKASERSTSISSVDSYRTAEFHTPTETPGHSDFNTPVQSLPGSDDESDFLDAHDAATPVPERADEFHSLPQDEYLPQSESPQVMRQQPQIDVIPPQIITTAVEDPTGGPHVTDDNEENPEDIDQAFAFYGSKSSLSFDRFEMGSRESIVSYYSDAGEGHFGNIPVTGEVQFGLKYDHRAGKLEVQIHRARDIAPVDTKKNKSDPYVKVYLLPDKTKGGKRKTRTKKNTLNPEFDEILTFKVGFDEMLTRSIWLTVWNHDRFGHNDFLGEIIFALESYEQSGFSWDYPSPEWYPLQERRPEPSLMEYCGELIVALKYVPPESIKDKKSKKKAKKGNLYVAMVEAHNLPSKDSNGFSDPFCKAYLLPDKSRKTKRKTPTIKKNLNPKWEHTIVYENLTLEDLMDRVLELTVWDWDRGMSNSFLGGVRLGMGARQEEWDDAEGEEIDAWRTMIDNPNEWNRFTLTLRSSMDSRVKTK